MRISNIPGNLESDTYVCQSYRSCKCVDKACTASREFVSSHSFRAHVSGHDFGRVDWLHGSECKSKHRPKYEDESNRSLGGCLAPSVDIASCCACGDAQAYNHACSRTKKHLPSPNNIMETGASGGEDPSYNRIYDIEQEFGIGAFDADIGQEVGQVV